MQYTNIITVDCSNLKIKYASIIHKLEQLDLSQSAIDKHHTKYSIDSLNSNNNDSNVDIPNVSGNAVG